MTDAEGDADEFEPHYYILKAHVDEPGHTDFGQSRGVSHAVAEALGWLRSDAPADERIGAAKALLSSVLEGVPRDDRLPSNRKRTIDELVGVLDELDDNELAGLRAGMLPARYMDTLDGGDVSKLMDLHGEEPIA